MSSKQPQTLTLDAFLRWEASSRDTIDFKRCYVDVAEDLVAGILLSQIVYWFLPDRKGVSKLTIERDGVLWLAKGREEWWAECRVKPKQFDRAIVCLEELGLVTTAVFRFGKSTSKHITVRFENLIKRLEEMGSRLPVGNSPKGNSGIPQTVIQELPKGENGNSPKGKPSLPQKGIPSIEVETTAETTAERGDKAPPVPPTSSAPVSLDASPTQCAAAIFERLAVVAPEKTQRLAAEAIRLQAASLCLTPHKAMLLIERTASEAQSRGEAINAFWFEDSKWKGSPAATPSSATVGMYLGEGPVEADEPQASVPEGADVDAGAKAWEGMSKAIKSKIGPQSWETWVRPFRSAGVLDGVLFVKMPNDLFAGVPDRYEFEEYLPQGIAEIRFLMAEGRAA